MYWLISAQDSMKIYWRIFCAYEEVVIHELWRFIEDDVAQSHTCGRPSKDLNNFLLSFIGNLLGRSHYVMCGVI